MYIYNYHPITRIFLNKTKARKNPLEPSNFLVPAFATTKAPPAAGDKEIIVYKEEDWTIILDEKDIKKPKEEKNIVGMRHNEYPSIQDQLNAILDYINPASDTDAYIVKKQIQDVNKKYPLPE